VWRRYYHVTHRDNVANIVIAGLDPTMSRGKHKVVWLCSVSRLPWAIAHVSAGHQWPIDRLRVLSVHVDPRSLKKWRWRGIYISDLNLPVYGLGNAEQILAQGPIVQPLMEK